MASLLAAASRPSARTQRGTECSLRRMPTSTPKEHILKRERKNHAASGKAGGGGQFVHGRGREARAKTRSRPCDEELHCAVQPSSEKSRRFTNGAGLSVIQSTTLTRCGSVFIAPQQQGLYQYVSGTVPSTSCGLTVPRARRFSTNGAIQRPTIAAY